MTLSLIEDKVRKYDIADVNSSVIQLYSVLVNRHKAFIYILIENRSVDLVNILVEPVTELFSADPLSHTKAEEHKFLYPAVNIKSLNAFPEASRNFVVGIVDIFRSGNIRLRILKDLYIFIKILDVAEALSFKK